MFFTENKFHGPFFEFWQTKNGPQTGLWETLLYTDIITIKYGLPFSPQSFSVSFPNPLLLLDFVLEAVAFLASVELVPSSGHAA